MDFKNDISLQEYALTVVFLLGLSILIVNSFFPSLAHINFYSIFLLIILASIPFFPRVTRLIVSPNKGFQIEKSTEKIREEAIASKADSRDKLKELKETLEEDEKGIVESGINNKLDQVRFEIEKIQNISDPKAAFMLLSAKIENELRELLKEEGITDIGSSSLYRMIEEAKNQDVLNRRIIDSLEDIRPLRNKVVHGERVNSIDAQYMIETGINIFEALLYERGTLEITEESISQAIQDNPEIIEEGLSIVELGKKTE